MTASIVAALLDCKLGNEQALVPALFRTKIISEATGATAYRCAFWRVVLERLVLSLADQQLITGISLLSSGFITERNALEGRQMELIVSLSVLSGSCHLVCVMTLREYFKRHMEVAYLRISAIILYAILLFVGGSLTGQPFIFLAPYICLAIYVPLSFDSLRAKIRLRFSKFLSGTIWNKIGKQIDKFQKQINRIQKQIDKFQYQIFQKQRNRFQKQIDRFQKRIDGFLKQIIRLRMFRPMAEADTVSISNLMEFGFVMITYGSFVISVYGTLQERLSYDSEMCKALDSEVNQWGFGQILPMFLLLLPLLSATEAYYGKLLLILGVPTTDRFQRQGTHERTAQSQVAAFQ